MGAVRKALQDLIAPELKEHTSILRAHAEALSAIVGVLMEQGEISRQHGERLARVDGHLEGIDGRLQNIDSRFESMDSAFRAWTATCRAWTAGLGESNSGWTRRWNCGRGLQQSKAGKCSVGTRIINGVFER